MSVIKYKDFRKVSSDKKSTVLRHAKGHELKIAHSVLSPEMRADLEKLPMAGGGEVKKYAQGAVVEDGGDAPDPSPDWLTTPGSALLKNQIEKESAPQISKDKVIEALNDPNSQVAKDYPDEVSKAAQYYGVNRPVTQGPAPASVPDSAPDLDANGVPVHLAPNAEPNTDPSPAPQPADNSQSAVPSPASLPIEPAPAAADVQPPATEYQKAYTDYKQAHQKEFAEQDAAFAQDLNNGHITPETYHALFAKKDTLGKIGTLFGMALSGAGSGLSHQPNALLAAMNQEINNDLQAQTQSKGNAQNLLKINQAQQLQEATIQNMQKTGQLTDAQAQSMRAEAGLKSFTLSQMQANRIAFHNQALMVAKMPEGQQKEQAKQVLGMMGTAVNGENANLQDIGASRAALLNATQNGGISTTGLRMVPGMEGVASDIDNKTIPGVGQAKYPVPQSKKDELEAMNVLDYKVNDLLNFAKSNKGTIDPKQRQIGAQKAEELLNYYNSSIKGGVLTEGRLKWLDQQVNKNPTSIFQDVLGNNSRLAEIRDSNAQRRNIMLKNLGAPTQASPNGPQEGQTSQSKSGKPVVFKNGKWNYQ